MGYEEPGKHSAELPSSSFATLRDAALRTLAATGLPTTADEDFKYTDLSSVADITSSWLKEPVQATPSAQLDSRIASLTGDTGFSWIVIRNGALTADAAAIDIDGLLIKPLSESPRSPDVTTPLSALNAALLEDGLYLEFASTPAKPVALLIADDAEVAASAGAVNIAISVADGVEANFVEYYVSSGAEPHYSSAYIALDVGSGGVARHVRIQDRAIAHSQTQNLTVTLGQDSIFRSAGFDFGGKLTRNDLLVDIPCSGADAEFNGLYLAGTGQHIDNHTCVNHRVGPARSRQEYRGILFGGSRAVWNGKAEVFAGADGTDADQANHNLLLSQDAEIDTKPELEIYAEDVRCSHGTTVGQLDEKALFYLRSRGLDEDDARQLLVQAFAAQTLDSVPVPEIRQHLAELLDARLVALRQTLASL